MNAHAQTLSATDRLTAEFFAYVAALSFEFKGDAEELHTDPRLSSEQRAWIADFIGRWEFAQAREDVVARFACGESIADKIGTLVLAGSEDAGFTLFVDGGLLPSGDDAEHFYGSDAALRALDAFQMTARQIANAALDL